MNISLLSIDISKNVFQLCSIDKQGKVVLEKRLKRDKLFEFIAQLPPCEIAMESCGSANYWGRKFKSLGHEVKLISAQYVRPFVKTNKNDKNDALGIAEAASRKHIPIVPIKSIEQQDIQSLHRIRNQLIQQRTALMNQIRGLAAEYGIVFAKGISSLKKAVPLMLEDAENELSDIAREFFNDLYAQFAHLTKQIKSYEHHIKMIYEKSEVCQRLTKVEGVGILTSTALVAAVGDGKTFKNGRHLSAWLGLVPRQHSSGEKYRLGGISKRGNKYLRTLLIHGSRAVIARCDLKNDKKSMWLSEKKKHCGLNKTIVALANKNARTLWVLLSKGEEYKPSA